MHDLKHFPSIAIKTNFKFATMQFQVYELFIDFCIPKIHVFKFEMYCITFQ